MVLEQIFEGGQIWPDVAKSGRTSAPNATVLNGIWGYVLQIRVFATGKRKTPTPMDEYHTQKLTTILLEMIGMAVVKMLFFGDSLELPLIN